MIIAHERSKVYGPMLEKVQGSVFFGVPHRGSDVAYWATFAATLLKYGQIGFGTNVTYVASLQRNSQTFADISQQFVERSSNISIRTFYETEKMLNQLVFILHIRFKTFKAHVVLRLWIATQPG